MRLAVDRRLTRALDACPLSPVRSLYYFLPVLDELSPAPPPDGYLEYLRGTVPDDPAAAATIASPKRGTVPA